TEAEEARAATRALGISLVAYSPLGRGLLTATSAEPKQLAKDDPRARHPRFSGDNLIRNRDLVAHIEAIALEIGCTQAQLVLAWLLAQGPDVTPIPVARRRARAKKNTGAPKVQWGADQPPRIPEATPAGAAAGTRYPEAQMKSVYL